ncbi:MAG: rod shape-determining protein MreC [Oscillospiraceae bacterium]|nr:rod shape-determining protein MreC [Oscillospiraceae bacterium]MCL2279229.1 rod shape-determining protein MreC [Oscillospiraceae bacterium]
MKTILNKRTIVIAGAAFLIALIAIISVNVFNTAGPVTGAANVLTRPARELASRIARAFGDVFAAMYEYEQLSNRNEVLLARVAELEGAYRDAIYLNYENERLRSQLGFRARHAALESEMANFVSWGSDNWSHSFIIDRGYTNSAIAQGMGVTTDHGLLIGQVFEVGPTTSTVITIIDTKFSVAAFVGRGEGDSSVTARGDFLYMRSGLLMLDRIDDELTIIPGDSVVTSGLGGVLPAALVIGEVYEVFPHASGIGRFATVRPMLDLNNISSVFVLIDFENPG